VPATSRILRGRPRAVDARRIPAAAVSATRIHVQFMRFAIVGGLGYLLNVGSFALLVHVAGLPIAVAASIAFLAAVTNNFLMNRRWTFGIRHGAGRGRHAWRFLAVAVALFLVALGLLSLMVWAGVAKVPAQAISILAVAPLSFLGNRYWAFG
jgi:putative flippase GtrA